MVSIQCIPLSMHHEHELASFLSDFAAHGETDIPAYFAPRDWTHQRIVDTFDGWSRGEGLKENWSLCYTRFLCRECPFRCRVEPWTVSRTTRGSQVVWEGIWKM